MDILERLLVQASGFSAPLSTIVCGACLILGTCLLPVCRMRGNHRSIGPECRPDEPLDGRECAVVVGCG